MKAKKKHTKAALALDRANIFFHLKRLEDLLDNHFENIHVEFTVVAKKKGKVKPKVSKKQLKKAYAEGIVELTDDDWEREDSDREHDE